jgi:hypothetical protein
MIPGVKKDMKQDRIYQIRKTGTGTTMRGINKGSFPFSSVYREYFSTRGLPGSCAWENSRKQEEKGG